MHLELVVPALFQAPDLPAAAMPALELLLARGRPSHGQTGNLETWLCRAFGLEEASLERPSVPAGALTALAYDLDPGAYSWLRADPVHLRADRDRVLLMPGHALSITTAEAEGLAAALAPLLAGKFVLHAVGPDHWCLRIEGQEPIDLISAKPPIDLAGTDIDPHLPPKQWHLLLTEIQMALYAHPVNTAREQRGEPVINSLWLWGTGTAPAASGPWDSIGATDAVATGLARSAGMRHRAPGGGAGEWLSRAPEEGRHLVVLDGLRGVHALGDPEALARRMQDLESNWFVPLLAALKSRRIGMLTIRVPETGASFETVRGDLNRFWRRPRPLTTYRITPA